MKKRLLASLLTLVMLLGLLPTAAFAVEEPQEDPVCICQVLCGDEVNSECPVCAEAPAQCAGEPEQPEDPPVCTCDVLCGDEGNSECPVCAEDPAQCAGEPEQPEDPPVCTCDVLCGDEVNSECPVCAEDPAQCAGKPEQPEKEVIPEAVQAFLNAVAELEENEDSITACGAAYDALTEEEQEREDVAEAYLEFMAVVKKLYARTPIAETAVYVSENGSDETGDGTQEKPVATLAKAVEIAQDGATIYVMSDLEMTSCARYYSKNLTIKSFGDEIYTITRGENFTPQQDNARSTYNPAMIEVGGTPGKQDASLRLENIILDDGGEKVGSYFIQADSEGDGKTEFVTSRTAGDVEYFYKSEYQNTEIVQDAIIATYNGTAEITLGDGAMLQNFGGMSAVRLSGGSLVMEAGSKICDTTVTNRTKADLQASAIFTSESGATKTYSKVEQDYGPAGAVWMQGGTFTMEEGAEISNMIGRAVYVDGGTVEINGVISDIQSDTDMWQGTSGVAMHLRSNAEATLTGTIQNCSGTGGMVHLQHALFVMEEGSALKDADINGITCGSSNDSDATYNTIIIDGEITGVGKTKNVNPIQAHSVTLTVGKTGYIHHNLASYGSIYAQQKTIVNLYGKINNNTSSGHGGGIATPAHGYVEINMYPGAEIKGNTAKSGGGITLGKTLFTMYGGEISDNHANTQGGGVNVRRSSVFIMKGGEISNNTADKLGGGISLFDDEAGQVNTTIQLLGGTITGNKMGSGDSLASNDIGIYYIIKNNVNCSGTISGDHVFISDDAKVGDPAVYMDQDTKTVAPDENSLDVKISNANIASITALTEEAEEVKGWSAPLATFWTQRDGAETLTVGGLTLATDQSGNTLPVYVLTQKTNAEGTPETGAEVKVYAATVDSSGNVTFTLPKSDTDENGCAVALVQPTADYGSVVITTTVPTLKQNKSAESYEIPYTATYTMSESFKNAVLVAAAQNPSLNGTFTFTVQLDDRLNAKQSDGKFVYQFTSDIFDVDENNIAVSSDGSTITVPCTLKSDWTTKIQTVDTIQMTLTGTGVLDAKDFKAGDSLYTTGSISVAVARQNIFIPANVCETKMIGLSKFTVTFDSDGGTAVPSQTVTEGEKVTQPADPTREGYTFTGWYEGDTDNKYDFTKAVNGDLILKAHWSKNSTGGGGGSKTYKVVYHANYGSDSTKTYSYSKNSTVTVKDYMLTDREGYVFDGWNTKANGRGTSYELGDTFKMPAETVDLYAQWVELEPELDTGVGRLLNTDDHIQYLYGYPDNTFGPTRSMTRAEASQMFFNLLRDQNVRKTVSFTDVDGTEWFADAVHTMASLGVIKGYPDGSFQPNKPITRAEFTTMAMNFAYPIEDCENPFNDVSKGDWFYTFVTGASQYGWISGYPDGSFKPNATITRAEVTSIVNNMLGRYADEDYVDNYPSRINSFVDLSDSYWAYYPIMEATNEHDYSKGYQSEDWSNVSHR